MQDLEFIQVYVDSALENIIKNVFNLSIFWIKIWKHLIVSIISKKLSVEDTNMTRFWYLLSQSMKSSTKYWW